MCGFSHRYHGTTSNEVEQDQQINANEENQEPTQGEEIGEEDVE